MTPYRFDNKKKNYQQKIGSYVVTVLVVAVIGLAVVFLGTFAVQKIIQVPAKASSMLGDQVAVTINALTPKSLLIHRIQKLEQEIQLLQETSLEHKAIAYDYQLLKQAVGYEPREMVTIPARVVGHPGRSLFNTMIIDKGTQDQIAVGDLVTTAGTLALGRVVRTTSQTAVVELFSNPSFEDNVFLQNQQGVMVPAKGKGSSNFEIHIPREITVQEGDLLVLPENPLLVLGVVKSIKFDPRDPFQTILARVPVNVQSIGFVEVVKK